MCLNGLDVFSLVSLSINKESITSKREVPVELIDVYYEDEA